MRATALRHFSDALYVAPQSIDRREGNSIAGAVVAFRDLRQAAVAVVAIGAPVAAADRPVFAGAHLRDPHADAVDVGRVAEPHAMVAEQPLVAPDADDGTAGRRFADRTGRGGQQREGEGDEKGTDGAHGQFSNSPIVARIEAKKARSGAASTRYCDVRVSGSQLGPDVAPAASGLRSRKHLLRCQTRRVAFGCIRRDTETHHAL